GQCINDVARRRWPPTSGPSPPRRLSTAWIASHCRRSQRGAERRITNRDAFDRRIKIRRLDVFRKIVGANVQGGTRGLKGACTYAKDANCVLGAGTQSRYDCAHLTLFGGPNKGPIEFDMVLLNRGRGFCIFPRQVDLLRRDSFEDQD